MEYRRSQSSQWGPEVDDVDIEGIHESKRCRHTSRSFCDSENSSLRPTDQERPLQSDDDDLYSKMRKDSASNHAPDFQISEKEHEILHNYLNTHGGQENSTQELPRQNINILEIKDNQHKVVRNVSSFRSRFWHQTIVLACWFILSFLTIVSNKYILSTLGGDIGILAECQLLMTTMFGLIKMYVPCYFAKLETTEHVAQSRFKFFKSMSILGWLRFGSVICSVVSLKYMEVSFSETIKSSAPIFTVIVAYLILGEYSGLYTNLSLIPIMFGLAMCFLGEITFSVTGFVAAVCNNILDCIQNVFSKKLLSGDDRYNPLELQFYTSVAASVVQLPFWVLFMDFRERLQSVDQFMIIMLLVNGLFFYLQSVTAYMLMSLISPVTFSVSSTVKRAALIWFSVIVFGNQITLTSAIGTVFVVIGVALYQRARLKESPIRERKRVEKDSRKLPV